MKALWIGIGIVCAAVLAITVVFITTSHDFREEGNRSDGTLLHALEGEPLEKHVPFLYDPYLDENMRKIVQTDLLLRMGDSVTLHADINEDEELLLFSNTSYLLNITVHKPDGKVSSISSHGSFLEYPLIIPVDQAGTWTITVNTEHTTSSHLFSLLLASRPIAVDLDLPDVTDDPYLLSWLVADMPGTIVVTENGEKPSLSQPLAEGRHELSFQRIMSDGRMSEVTHHILMVDSDPPEITFGDFERETNFPRVLLKLNLSDDVRDLYINGEQYNKGSRTLEGEILESVPLEMGENVFELRAVSVAGRETVQTVTITRIESEREEA